MKKKSIFKTISPYTGDKKHYIAGGLFIFFRVGNSKPRSFLYMSGNCAKKFFLAETVLLPKT